MSAAADEAQPQMQGPMVPAPVLRAVVVCDLVNSAQLTQRLGDVETAELAQRLDRLARDLIYRYAGREIDKSDGFLLLFERPVLAVAFALDYQRGLRELGQSESLPLAARIGIHVGDVVVWENAAGDVARGAKPVEVEGLAKSVAARLMSLALPGQILLSAIACTLAQRAQSELVAQRAPPQWKIHGRYRFKGVAEAMRVVEVGERGIAPLKRPAWSGKAHREVPWWRRPSVLAVEAVALAAAIAIPAYLSLRSPPALAFAQRDWIVLGDLNNLTREIVLDGSLETAFRLGLEQSRYVNVMSDLKVRDTLALMQRDPDKTRVDRAVGSEVAIRDGARALIIPTVAEVGGHVRVTAEVVDPKTQATVYTESADGKGLNSVLPTIDALDQRLRLRLGEALASVSKTNQPLEQVATANLDALRAYSLGQRAYFTGNMKDALAFYQDAVRLDPQFATAHLVIARVFLNAHNYIEVLKQLSAVESSPLRLSNKDKLFIQAWQATINDPTKSLDQWRTLTDLYPDYYLANGLFSYFAWFENQYDTAISAAKLNTAPQNASRSAGIYLLGILYLAQEKYADAIKQFQLAADAGITRNDYYALAYAAQRQFDRAHTLLDESKQANIPGDDLDTQLVRIAIAADQGSWQIVDTMLDVARGAAAQQGELEKLRVQGIALALRSQLSSAPAPDLVRYAQATLGSQVGNEVDRRQMRFQAMVTAYLLTRMGDSKSAGRIMAMPEVAAAGRDDVLLKNMRLIITAELLRAEKQPGRAANILKPLVDGHELYITHLALLDAYADNGEVAQALNEAQWLSSHRGRAYGEYGEEQFMMAFNVVQTDLALLRAAELEQRLGQTDASTRSLAAFNNAWPHAGELKNVQARLALLPEAAHK